MDGLLILGGLVIVGGGAIMLFGCDLGIEPICTIQSKMNEKFEQIGEGGGGEEGTVEGTPEEELPADTEPVYERLTLTEVMDALAEMAVLDIDDCTYFALGRDKRFNIKSMVLRYYKSWLEEIAENNDVSLKPLTGRALAKYAQMILDVSRRAQIQLNPACENQLRSELFSGTPLLGQVTSNYTRLNVS